MGTYLVEFFLPRSAPAEQPPLADQVQEAVAAAVAAGSPVRLVEAICVPGEELYLCVFEGPSADDVRRLLADAGLPAEGRPEQVRLVTAAPLPNRTEQP